MTLPAGNPVVSGTQISSTTHNATMNDVATEIGDSLSRSGKGGMVAPLRTPDGSVSTPTHSWTSDTDVGLFLKGVANPAMSVGGSEKQEWTSAGSKVTGTFETTGAVTAGAQVNLSSVTSDPASPADGALWYRSDTDKFKARANGATESIATESYVQNLTPLVIVGVAADGTIRQQRGRFTVTCTKTFTGTYQVSAVGVTANFMATVTAHSIGTLIAGATAGVDVIQVDTRDAAGTSTNTPFTLIIWAL